MSARLLDNGNLVLQANTTGLITWESFQHPSDSWLADMKLGTNETSGQNIQITSWKSPSDPGTGTFSGGIFFFNLPEMYIWNGSSPYWRSGPWNGMIFIGIPNMRARYLNGFRRENDKLEGSFFLAFEFSNKSEHLHYTLNAEGNSLETYSINGKDWGVSWSSLMSECDVYGKCGAFGSCNPKNKPICSCLNGFKPKNIEEWNREDWSSGCVRRTPLQCMRVSTGGKEGKKDGFLKLKMMKTPSLANWSFALADGCRYQCLEDCSCIAFAYEIGIGCMYWTRDLIDSRKFSIGGADLYVRVAYSELDKKEELKIIVEVSVVFGLLVFMAVYTLFLRQWIARPRGGRYQAFHCKENLVDNMNQDKLQELPIFSLEELASATNNFHQSNKLGQGGFGPVYKIPLNKNS